MSESIRYAITLLQLAREKLEIEVHFRDPDCQDRQDLEDNIEDIGQVLYSLENFLRPIPPMSDGEYARAEEDAERKRNASEDFDDAGC